MRKNFKATVGSGVVAFMVMSSGVGATQVAEKYLEVSDALVVEATSKITSNDTAEAQALFERALVANPANIQALIGLGKTHEAQGRVGRGLTYYRKALMIDPNALRALEAQAVAFLKRDMPERAADNRDRLAQLCGECEPLRTVTSALANYEATRNETVADASAGNPGS